MDFDLAVTMGWSYSYTYTLMVGYQFLLITGQWWAVLLATGIAVIYLIEFYNRWMNYGWSSAVWF